MFGMFGNCLVSVIGAIKNPKGEGDAEQSH